MIIRTINVSIDVETNGLSEDDLSNHIANELQWLTDGLHVVSWDFEEELEEVVGEGRLSHDN